MADCEVKCTFYFGDSNYLTTVNNFTLGGAPVHFHSSPPALHIGDRCKIRMNGGALHEYSCEVIRVETPTIALMFADTHE